MASAVAPPQRRTRVVEPTADNAFATGGGVAAATAAAPRGRAPRLNRDAPGPSSLTNNGGANGGLLEPEATENECGVCGGEGELTLCDFPGCVKVHHASCIGISEALDEAVKLYCPMHACGICGAKEDPAAAAAADGGKAGRKPVQPTSSQFALLRHCASCPSAYCVACAPPPGAYDGVAALTRPRELAADLFMGVFTTGSGGAPAPDAAATCGPVDDVNGGLGAARASADAAQVVTSLVGGGASGAGSMGIPLELIDEGEGPRKRRRADDHSGGGVSEDHSPQSDRASLLVEGGGDGDDDEAMEGATTLAPSAFSPTSSSAAVELERYGTTSAHGSPALGPLEAGTGIHSTTSTGRNSPVTGATATSSAASAAPSRVGLLLPPREAVVVATSLGASMKGAPGAGTTTSTRSSRSSSPAPLPAVAAAAAAAPQRSDASSPAGLPTSSASSSSSSSVAVGSAGDAAATATSAAVGVVAAAARKRRRGDLDALVDFNSSPAPAGSSSSSAGAGGGSGSGGTSSPAFGGSGGSSSRRGAALIAAAAVGAAAASALSGTPSRLIKAASGASAAAAGGSPARSGAGSSSSSMPIQPTKRGTGAGGGGNTPTKLNVKSSSSNGTLAVQHPAPTAPAAAPTVAAASTAPGAVKGGAGGGGAGSLRMLRQLGLSAEAAAASVAANVPVAPPPAKFKVRRYKE